MVSLAAASESFGQSSVDRGLKNNRYVDSVSAA